MQTQTPKTVTVNLGTRSYDILIGDDLISQAGIKIAECLPKANAHIITDETVAGFHLKALQNSLNTAGIKHDHTTIKPGETSKSLNNLEMVVHAILDAKRERGDVVIALGGGVVGDLSGFAAAIVRRGMKFVQIPTSLLAQVDSSVGGKTGINAPHGKNLIGAFHQPDLVLADTSILDTLSPRHMRAGYAEVAKYGLINDHEFYTWLEKNWQAIFAGGEARQHAVAMSCQSKASIVARDEKEMGERALLNLGHTFGHALEAATGYSDRLVHGEAIAIGMTMAHQFSNKMNLASIDDAKRVESHFKAVGLPTRLSDIAGDALPIDMLMEKIAQDKKVSRGTLTFILTRGIGEAYIADNVPPSEVRAFLENA